MEDSFSVRVDKTFGALRSGGQPSVGVTAALWCLTDEEIERKEWNRDTLEDLRDCGVQSAPSNMRKQMEMDRQHLSDEEEEEGEEDEGIDGEKKKRRRNNGGGADISADEYLDVQSNIGRDPTLDYEEEEDQYDKVAVGAEHQGDRIYMKDVKVSDYEVDEPSAYGELPSSLHDVVKDARANHTAAKMRLKEDAEAAGNFDTLQLSDDSVAAFTETGGNQQREDTCENPKPILKKTENTAESRAPKRVRFLVDPKISSTQTHVVNQSAGATSSASDPNPNPDDLSLYASGVPDYIRNPSKYTRYTFDSSDDMDDKSNQKAFMDLFQRLRKQNSDSSMDETSVEVPKSVTFVPKRKSIDESTVKKNDIEDGKNKRCSISATAEDAQESETSAMDEDEPIDDSPGATLAKPGRQYRTRANVDDADEQ
ncbi:uncharacterized protein LOC127263648 [Andrographis paniculata]|uniref:uncharacterized protein LOC127263648 n=1 Tax=Andrographis paniculata TaxID=175694 RepID=UPI0021E7212E|nr:uncharacterized protein LOC127263648 [Andrographis paniculata]